MTSNPLKGSAWLPIPPTLPKEVIANIIKLVDLKVMERLGNEIRFRHEFMPYYEKASIAVNKADDVKNAIAHEYAKGGFDKDMEDSVIRDTIMEGAMRKYLQSLGTKIDANPNSKEYHDLINDAGNLKELLDSSNELKSAFHDMNK